MLTEMEAQQVIRAVLVGVPVYLSRLSVLMSQLFAVAPNSVVVPAPFTAVPPTEIAVEAGVLT